MAEILDEVYLSFLGNVVRPPAEIPAGACIPNAYHTQIDVDIADYFTKDGDMAQRSWQEKVMNAIQTFEAGVGKAVTDKWLKSMLDAGKLSKGPYDAAIAKKTKAE